MKFLPKWRALYVLCEKGHGAMLKGHGAMLKGAGENTSLANEYILSRYCIKMTRNYHNFPKYSDTQKICCNHSKIWTMWLYKRVMSPNDADGMANSVDPDQTAPLGAVWSGSALFAQACLSENLGSLRYLNSTFFINVPHWPDLFGFLPRHPVVMGIGWKFIIDHRFDASDRLSNIIKIGS